MGRAYRQREEERTLPCVRGRRSGRGKRAALVLADHLVGCNVVGLEIVVELLAARMRAAIRRELADRRPFGGTRVALHPPVVFAVGGGANHFDVGRRARVFETGFGLIAGKRRRCVATSVASVVTG